MCLITDTRNRPVCVFLLPHRLGRVFFFFFFCFGSNFRSGQQVAAWGELIREGCLINQSNVDGVDAD